MLNDDGLIDNWKCPAGLTGPGLLTYPNVPKCTQKISKSFGSLTSLVLLLAGCRGLLVPLPLSVSHVSVLRH